jgi:uncharacterized protein YndB with AHSA1/START domain
MPRTRLPAVLWSPWSVALKIDAPPQVVWDLLVDTDAWPRWGPTVLAAEAATDRLEAGARGRVKVPPGVWLRFEVTDVEPGTYWAWKVAGVPATGHRVTPSGSGCRVTFEVPWWAPGYLAVCAVALRRLALLVGPAGRPTQ